VLPFFSKGLDMSVEQLADSLKDYAKDIRLNLITVLAADGAPGLTPAQIWLSALACAYATRNHEVRNAVEAEARKVLDEAGVEAAKAAATIMAMNNVYYRTVHMMENKDIGKLPARLRMSVIGKPGVEKVDFELACLAVSAIAGCGACINAHVHEALKAGISNEGVQSSYRIGAVVNAAAQAHFIG
jgi:alkyl hydroperoxide reductase subunit D